MDEAALLQADESRRKQIDGVGLPDEMARYFKVRGMSVEDAEAAKEKLVAAGCWTSPDGGYEVHSTRDVV